MEADTFDFENGEDHSDLPPPVIFNCWKHHLGFIRRQIAKYSDKLTSGPERVNPYLLLIGNSQTDIYTGDLQEGEISAEILKELTAEGLNAEDEYNKWIISAPKNFRLIRLSDGSIWTLRKGIQTGRYIHLHPGRHTLNSIRIRANTLKTAILSIIISESLGVSPLDLSTINQTRIKALGLAPIKSVEKSKGLKEFISLIMAE